VSTAQALLTRAGGAAARPDFAVVAEAHLDAVHRYLAHLTGDRHLADDLASETFERALRAWRRFDPRRGPALVWLLRIARNAALDHIRGEGRRREREARYAAGREDSAPAPEGPGGLSPAMRAALERLTPEEREVLALRVVLGLDGAEAAALTGSTPSAVATRLHRALTKLRREVSEHDERS
jgi:RNA polymerase sigma-70 factor, ECF subfamily